MFCRLCPQRGSCTPAAELIIARSRKNGVRISGEIKRPGGGLGVPLPGHGGGWSGSYFAERLRNAKPRRTAPRRAAERAGAAAAVKPQFLAESPAPWFWPSLYVTRKWRGCDQPLKLPPTSRARMRQNLS